MHVARRIEEVHTAEAWLQRSRQRIGQLVNGQTRGVGSENGVFAQVRANLGIQVCLPVHALSNRLDHQIAVFQQVQVIFVVGWLDKVHRILVGQRGRLELFQAFDSFQCNRILVAFFGRKVEQNGWHLGINQMSGDLRPHHAGAQNGYLAYDEFGLRHGFLGCLNEQTWLNASRIIGSR